MNQPILFDDIYVRHPYKYKGTKSLDVKLFKNEILLNKKIKKFFTYLSNKISCCECKTLSTKQISKLSK